MSNSKWELAWTFDISDLNSSVGEIKKMDWGVFNITNPKDPVTIITSKMIEASGKKPPITVDKEFAPEDTLAITLQAFNGTEPAQTSLIGTLSVLFLPYAIDDSSGNVSPQPISKPIPQNPLVYHPLDLLHLKVVTSPDGKIYASPRDNTDPNFAFTFTPDTQFRTFFHYELMCLLSVDGKHFGFDPIIIVGPYK